jgi:hypothetical protein
MTLPLLHRRDPVLSLSHARHFQIADSQVGL